MTEVKIELCAVNLNGEAYLRKKDVMRALIECRNASGTELVLQCLNQWAIVGGVK